MPWRFYAEGKEPGNIVGADGGLDGVSGILLLYPYCGLGTASRERFVWNRSVPVLQILAGSDAGVDARKCVAWGDAQIGNPHVHTIVYEEAEHTFDIPPSHNRNPKRFSPELLGQAKEDVRMFLGE